MASTTEYDKTASDIRQAGIKRAEAVLDSREIDSPSCTRSIQP